MQRAVKTGDYEALTIKKDGFEYTLPANWTLNNSGSYQFRNSLQDKAFAHGGDMVGDGKVDGRTIEVEFFCKGTTEQEHDEILNRAYRFFAQTGYDLCAGRHDRVYHVAGIAKMKHQYQKGYKQRWSSITVSLLLADPFRYESQESKVTYEFIQDAYQAEIVVHNLGSVDTPLAFKFIPKKKMAELTVWHQEAAEKFTLTDAMLIAPASTIVNAKEGTVWRSDNNSINTFSGQFLHAHPGSNLFLFTGGAGTVEITYTNRWFI